jgi:aryl-alcohol dehydrogenase-like predicted oxidoreductase
MVDSPIQTNSFGQTGQLVTKVGLGGEGILRTHGRTNSARGVIKEAIDQGIAYFDCARVYAGSEGYYGTLWLEQPDTRARIFQASKSASRDREGALADLETSLSTMGTPYLDLWQIHDVRADEDIRCIEKAGGALEAFIWAKAKGKTRSIGVTGHHDPLVLARAVRSWPVDAVMMPVNVVEGALGGFQDITMAEARDKGMAVIGMKVLGASHFILPELGLTPEVLIRYALSLGVDVAIVGCATPQEVRVLASGGRTFEPMSSEEQRDLVERVSPYASRLAYYRGFI